MRVFTLSIAALASACVSREPARPSCLQEVADSDWGVVGPGGITAEQLVAVVDGATLAVETGFGSQTWSVQATPAGTPSVATREVDSANCPAGVVWLAPVHLSFAADDGSWAVDGTVVLEGDGATLDAVSVYYAEQELLVTTAPEPLSIELQTTQQLCPEHAVGIHAVLHPAPLTWTAGRIQMEIGAEGCGDPNPGYTFEFAAAAP